MQNKVKFFLFFLVFHIQLQAVDCSLREHLGKRFKKELTDFILPANHPLNLQLDYLFSDRKTLQDFDSLAQAGFTFIQKEDLDAIVVIKHEKLPGYIIKTFLDNKTPSDPFKDDIQLIKRIIGSRLIKDSIQFHNYESLFKVPEKWLYMVPDHESKCPFSLFILVEDDMEIIPDETLWQSGRVNKELLKALFTIVSEISLNGVKPKNIPFCQDGKIAFIDTGTYYKTQPHFFRLAEYLTPETAAYWRSLYEN